MNVITETELLARIADFLKRHDMAPTTFGRNATGEPQLIDSLEKGRSPSLRVVNKVIDYMARVDREASLAAAPPPGHTATEDVQLPFASAPVNPTGASSPTSCSTPALPVMPAASASSPCSSDADA